MEQTIKWKKFDGYDSLESGYYILFLNYGATYIPYLHLHINGKPAPKLKPEFISRLCKPILPSIEELISSNI